MVPQPAGPPPTIAGSSPSPKRTGCLGIAGGVTLGILLGFGLLLGGCVALLAVAANQADENGVGGSSSRNSELDDVIGCELVEPGRIQLEVVNSSPKTSTYLLNIGFFDQTGTRVADQGIPVPHLRPDERAIERHPVLDRGGVTCRVIGGDRLAADSAPDELGEATCVLDPSRGPLGRVRVAVTATNGTPLTSDYRVGVAVIDASGSRRGAATVRIPEVQPGDSAGDRSVPIDDGGVGTTCEVARVERNAS